ncbi:MAG: transcriptional regulator [Bacteroidetes bacterium]|jgi:DNA-binding MarR family transcriptional regulator|nr:transcriptional regulator [Bacteroidota bacterium]
MGIGEDIKQSKFRSQHHKMIVNLVYTTNWLNTIQMREFKAFGLSSQQYNILRILRGQGKNTVNLGLIQERMLDKNSNASRLIEKLRLKKLIERKESRADRRQVDIMITDKGLELLDLIDERMEPSEVKFKALSPEEADQLSNLLDKLRS